MPLRITNNELLVVDNKPASSTSVIEASRADIQITRSQIDLRKCSYKETNKQANIWQRLVKRITIEKQKSKFRKKLNLNNNKQKFNKLLIKLSYKSQLSKKKLSKGLGFAEDNIALLGKLNIKKAVST